jgi:DNA (cytosine-5)-methyltransferase 1
MRPKSGMPKRKALRRNPEYKGGLFETTKLTSDRKDDLSYSVLSLFSGCGGLDLGLLGGFNYLGKKYKNLNFKIIGSYDIDQKSIDTHNLNLNTNAHVSDLSKVPTSELPIAQILTGGFPCQDFSSSGLKKGMSTERGQLFTVLRDYMKLHKPLIAVGENVPFLEKLDNGIALKTIKKEFEKVGYKVQVWKIYCPDYGLPQSRTRLFIICVRNDIEGFPDHPVPTHVFKHVSIDEALDDLVVIEDETIPNQSQYFMATKATAGAGQGDQKSKKGELAYTVRANAKARIHFHYSLDRRLTVRECARLQSFPDEFVFPHAAMNAMTQIGNAVPPIIGHVIGKQLQKFLDTVKFIK